MVEQESEPIQVVTQISIGDISVTSSKENLKLCEGVIKKLLKNSSVKNYLNICTKKKFISSSIG